MPPTLVFGYAWVMLMVGAVAAAHGRLIASRVAGPGGLVENVESGPTAGVEL
jgi:hypothetical protein